MDRKYLEQHLVAYLDGELAVAERQEFEREIEKHPDLREQLEEMKKLDKLARTTEIEMPAPGYFDNLAERIDAAVARQPEPQADSFLSRLARPWPRVVALVGSAAAVLLIALISQELYQPAVEKYSMPPQAPRALLQDSGAGEVVAGRDKPECDSVSVIRVGLHSIDNLQNLTYGDEVTEQAAPPEPKPEADAAPTVAIPDEEKVSTPAAELAEIVSDAILPDEVKLEEEIAPVKKQSLRSKQMSINKGATRQTTLSDSEGVQPGLASLETQEIERFGALSGLDIRGGHSLLVTAAQLDSAIAAQDSLGNEQEAMILSYQRAGAFRTAENLRDARTRIESYLDKADLADRSALESYLAQLRQWESEQTNSDSTD